MDKGDLLNRFTYHPPHSDQLARYSILREFALDFADRIHEHCPDSCEKSLAITKLEEAVMWANASIARNEKAPEG